MFKSFRKTSFRAALTSLMLLAASLTPALAYYFEGYYVPVLLISPMRDDQIYTPAGLGVVTSNAGFRVHPVTGKGDFHNGVDLGAHLNDKVYELLDGVVVKSGYRGNLGVAVEVYHPYPNIRTITGHLNAYTVKSGYRGNLGVAVEVYHPYPNIRTITGHLNAYTVKPGMWVRRGQVIGYAGSTGRSTGVHVHYTVIQHDSNNYIDPMKYLMQVPQYVMALKTARAQAAMAANKAAFQKKQSEKKSSDKDDLPESSDEGAPPDAH